MFTRSVRSRSLLTLTAGLLLLPQLALAEIKDFSLARAIPSDVFLAVHAREHDGRAFVNAQYERFMEAVREQHFEKDFEKLIKALIKEAAAEGEGTEGADTTAFDQQWQEISDLFATIDWAGMFSDEFAFTEKIEFPTPQFVMLLKPTDGKAAPAFDGLSALAKKLVSMAPEGEIVLNTDGDGSSVVHRVVFTRVPVPFGLTLAREKDALLFGFGATLPEQCLNLLRGGEGEILAKTERFQQAFSGLPSPEDQLTYMDLRMMFQQVNGMIDAAVAMSDPAGDQVSKEEKEIPAKILAEADIFEYLASVATTDGKKTTTDTRVLLREGVSDKMVYKGIFGGGPFANPLEYVPATASGFSAWGGLDMMAMYVGVRQFITANIPGGGDMISEFDVHKNEMPFDLEKDLIGQIGGRFVSFSLPGRSAYAPGDWAFMMSVTDDARLQARLDELVAQGDAMMKQNQQGSINEADVGGATGFRSVQSPMLMMIPGFGSPTFGVKDGWMFLGSSPKVIGQALATAAGDAPNFSTNERFKTEGLELDSNVVAASFTDMTKFGDELSQALMMVPMMGMFVPDINKHPAGRMAISVCSKMGKVVKKLDFFQSSCSKTTRDGRVLHSVAVTNYREPPAPPTEASASSN